VQINVQCIRRAVGGRSSTPAPAFARYAVSTCNLLTTPTAREKVRYEHPRALIEGCLTDLGRQHEQRVGWPLRRRPAVYSQTRAKKEHDEIIIREPSGLCISPRQSSREIVLLNLMKPATVWGLCLFGSTKEEAQSTLGIRKTAVDGGVDFLGRSSALFSIISGVSRES
jgi:hypothetical protein